MKRSFVKKVVSGLPKVKIAVIACMIPAFVIVCSIWAFAGIGDSDIVAYINGEPVTVREYSRALLEKRNDTYAYFKEKYGVDDSADFWSQKCGDEVPLEKVRKDALDHVARIKLQQLLAKEKGLVSDIAYSSLLKELELENAARRDALKKKGVIYGPRQYDEKSYFDRVFSDLTARLKEQLRREAVFDESAVAEYYRNNISNYRVEDTARVEVICVSYLDASPVGRDEAERIIKDIKAKLEKGESPDSILEAYAGNEAVKRGEQSFGPMTAKSDLMVSKELAGAASKLSAGQVSEILDFNGACHILKCVEKAGGKLLTLEEAREGIEDILFEAEYRKQVDKMVTEARIVIVDRVYGKAGEEYLR